MAFAEEEVTKQALLIMEELGKTEAHSDPLTKIAGPAPAGQAEDTLAKTLQPLNLQDAAPKNKKKNSGGQKAIKDNKEKVPLQTGGSSHSWETPPPSGDDTKDGSSSASGTGWAGWWSGYN